MFERRYPEYRLVIVWWKSFDGSQIKIVSKESKTR
jgi:hypothetical protein